MNNKLKLRSFSLDCNFLTRLIAYFKKYSLRKYAEHNLIFKNKFWFKQCKNLKTIIDINSEIFSSGFN